MWNPSGEEPGKDEVRDDAAETLEAELRDWPGDVVRQLRTMGATAAAERVVRRRRTTKSRRQNKIVDWSSQPYVRDGAEEEHAEMMGKDYPAMDEAEARARFTKHSMD